MARNLAQNYRKAQFNTASPGQRVVMMYEGLSRELKKARHSMIKIKEDIEMIEKTHNSISLSQQIILELKLALDKERGGEIAENLENLYDFWTTQLSEANHEQNSQKLGPVIEMVDELCDTWKQATKKARQLGA